MQEGHININLKTGHSLDAYAFGILVSDILDTRADLGKLHNMLLKLVSHGNVKFDVWSPEGNIPQPFCNLVLWKWVHKSTYTLFIICSPGPFFATVSIDILSVLGDAGEKFGEKMQSLFLHENPQVN